MAAAMNERAPDLLRLEVHGIETDVLTGIYSEETRLPQPLRISVVADMRAPPDPFQPETPLSASKNYMDLRRAATDALPKDRHFTLIEAVADHIVETIMFDPRILRVEVKIVKLAISEGCEEIGMTLVRSRP
ncbi:MAG TPA: dihydroneopterin aldolase [Allosphingosinicella sp.]|jgi:dihydroneopterin aldolase